MSLTRKLLKDLELTDSAIERIIAAHVETVDALRQERDAAQQLAADREETARERDQWRTSAEEHLAALTKMQNEFSAYRMEVEEAQHRDARRAALADALARFGANEHAIPLLLDALPLTEEDWHGDVLADEGSVLNAAKAKYAPLFAVPKALATTVCTPPISPGGTLTHEDLRRMSVSDINRNWSAVAAALDR